VVDDDVDGCECLEKKSRTRCEERNNSRDESPTGRPKDDCFVVLDRCKLEKDVSDMFHSEFKFVRT